MEDLNTEIKKTKTVVPHSPGFWWAKTDSCKWANVIVEVKGEAPFLKLRAWDLVSDSLRDLEAWDIKEWVVEINNTFGEIKND